MRTINWNDEVFQKAYDRFETMYGRKLSEHQRLGFAAEALVQDYYGATKNYEMPEGPDGGCDFVWKGARVDVKCDTCDVNFFSNSNTLFTVCTSGRELKSDVYLFVKIDPKSKTIALIGYLSAFEVTLKGMFYARGEYIPAFNKCSNRDCYLVSQKDLSIIHKID